MKKAFGFLAMAILGGVNNIRWLQAIIRRPMS